MWMDKNTLIWTRRECFSVHREDNLFLSVSSDFTVCVKGWIYLYLRPHLPFSSRIHSVRNLHHMLDFKRTWKETFVYFFAWWFNVFALLLVFFTSFYSQLLLDLPQCFTDIMQQSKVWLSCIVLLFLSVLCRPSSSLCFHECIQNGVIVSKDVEIEDLPVCVSLWALTTWSISEFLRGRSPHLVPLSLASRLTETTLWLSLWKCTLCRVLKLVTVLQVMELAISSNPQWHGRAHTLSCCNIRKAFVLRLLQDFSAKLVHFWEDQFVNPGCEIWRCNKSGW